MKNKIQLTERQVDDIIDFSFVLVVLSCIMYVAITIIRLGYNCG